MAKPGEMGYPSALSPPKPASTTFHSKVKRSVSSVHAILRDAENVLFKISFPAEFHSANRRRSGDDAV